ncbi:MAG: single-stranded DNA-binding protein [Candidatus Aminicenantes bacterium]|nr:MAG: single-stranded DNA-binding protein [Candidatus Aminicenantes bacterium]
MRDINSLNKATLIGRLGQKPELRYLPQTERAVARFTLATNERYFNPKTNESDIRAEWHRIVAWGKLAEFCEKYLTQGKQIYLEGKLRTRSWQDREGNKRYTTEIEAQNIVLLGRREEAGVQEEESYPKPSTPSGSSEEEENVRIEEGGEEDDEVPF